MGQGWDQVKAVTEGPGDHSPAIREDCASGERQVETMDTQTKGPAKRSRGKGPWEDEVHGEWSRRCMEEHTAQGRLCMNVC